MPDSHPSNSNEEPKPPANEIADCYEEAATIGPQATNRTIAPLGQDTQPLTEPTLSASERLASYQNKNEIDTWEFGKVYEASHPKLDRLVWLLVLDQEHTANEKVRARFLDRVRSLATISHPNVETGIWEAIDDPEVVYIAFEPSVSLPLPPLGPRKAEGKKRNWFYDSNDKARKLCQGLHGLIAIRESGISHGAIGVDCIRQNRDTGNVIVSGLVTSSFDLTTNESDPSSSQWETDLRDFGLAFSHLLCGAGTEFEMCSEPDAFQKLALSANEEISPAVLRTLTALVFPKQSNLESSESVVELKDALFKETLKTPKFVSWIGRIGTLFYDAVSFFWVIPLIAILASSKMAGNIGVALILLLVVAWHIVFEVVFGRNIGRRFRQMHLLYRNGGKPSRRKLFYRWMIRFAAVTSLGAGSVALIYFALRSFDVVVNDNLLFFGAPLGVLLTYCTSFFLSSRLPVHDHLSGVTLCKFDHAVAQQNSAIQSGTQYRAEETALGQSSPQGDLADNNVDQFKIVGELGRGGMGTVYSATDLTLNRKVAIKLVASHLVSGSEAVSRFEREARLAAQLNHHNVARVLGVGNHDGAPYLAMEYIGGQDLDSLIKTEGPVAARLAWDYVIQAATGLKAVNELGIIHRDIKPANLMLDQTGVVKVMDFGLSKMVGDPDKQDVTTAPASCRTDEELTQLGALMGTPMYMSPEQAKAQDLSTASDIYSLGLTLYALLTGRAPFEFTDSINLISKQIAETPDMATGQLSNLDVAQKKVLERMIAKDVDSRYQNYDSLLHDLQLTCPQAPAIASFDERLTAMVLTIMPIELVRYGAVVIAQSFLQNDAKFLNDAFSVTAYFLIYPAIYIFGVWRWGTTPGKWLRGIRVVTTDGGPVSLINSTIRFLAYCPYAAGVGLAYLYDNGSLTNLPHIVWLVSILLICFSSSKRGLHDWAAGTKVVKKAPPANPKLLSKIALAPDAE